ncbi:MAG: VOC family protein [Anaerolineae bacterium]
MLSPILSVHDIDASLDYYTTKLGFTLNWKMPGEDGKTSFAGVKLGKVEVLLGTIDFVAEADRSKLGTGIQLYIDLDAAGDFNINTLYQQATAAGAIITRPIEDRDWGERAFNVKDPDGYQYMFAQRLQK